MGRFKRSSKPYRNAPSVEHLTEENVRAIVELEREAKAHRGFAERLAHVVATFCGTLGFVFVHVLWFGAWIAWNTLGPGKHPDPFPFTFLTLVVSLEAIFLSAFILISQNEEGRIAERRNALDLQINLLTEQENTKMLRLLGAIAKKLEIQDNDPTGAVLEQATRPEKLAEQIDRISAES